MSELGRAVADLLGNVFLGIYHLKTTSLCKVDWQSNISISVVVCRDIATYDGDELTSLVVLCHDRLLRLEIEAAARRYLRLWFSQRTSRVGRLYDRHPTLEDAAKSIRLRYCSGTGCSAANGADEEI